MIIKWTNISTPRGTRPALIYTQGDTSIWTWIWVFLNQISNLICFSSLNYIFLPAVAWEIQVGNRLCRMVYATSVMGQFSYTVFVYHKSPADCKLSSVYMLHQEWVYKLSFSPYLSALDFFPILQFEILSLINWIFFPSLKYQVSKI